MKLEVVQPITRLRVERERGATADEIVADAPDGFVPGETEDAGMLTVAVRGRSDRSLALGANASSPAAGGMIQHKLKEAFMTTQNALLALLARHTVKPPKLSLPETMRALVKFEEKADELPANQQKLLAADPAIGEAMLNFLAYRFTPVDLSAARAEGDFNAAMEAAGHVLMLSSPPTQRRFLEEIIFNVAHPAEHRLFAPMLKSLFTPEVMEKALLEHAQSDNTLHQRNVFALMPHLYARADYRSSDRGQRELFDIARALAKNEETNSVLRETAAELTGVDR